jgi:hypothetical protein
MAKGKAKKIENANARLGSWSWYWFIKVKHKDQGEAEEEYWLVTEDEREKFDERAAKAKWWRRAYENRGILHRVKNTGDTFGTVEEYWAVVISFPPYERETLWLLTPADHQRLIERSLKNSEDIAREREGWLADLFD